jgi:DNA invertase Pin-like site-specific DNA recombinase
MIQAAIYVRVSTSRQAERDLSIPDQIAQCQAYCDRQGWEVVKVYSEPGASALDDDRPVFQEMIHAAKSPERPFARVVVHSLSRFSRDTLHSELYVRQLAKAGVQLISITQDVGQDASGEFIRKILNVFDEHQSRETAKHVHRAMLENARQGFWNGSRPPFGYGVEIKERRGNKDKKVLVIEADEAPVVRRIFALASGVEGRPLGVKAIATHLNERGVTRRGRRFSTGSVYEILTDSTYHGLHYFNRFDSRSRKPRPPSEWVPMEVPAIIEESAFNAVQALLASRNPKRIAPRVVNGPTLLAGIARCGVCGAALIQNTGKGGRYRYYCCSRKLKEGAFACDGFRMPMDRLDDIVVSEVTRSILEPDRLQVLLERYLKTAERRDADDRQRLAELRQAHKDAEAGISRLLDLVTKGLMDAEDPSLREKLPALKFRRDELAREVADLQRRITVDEPTITPEKVQRVAMLLKDKLQHGPAELRQAYARLVIGEVSVDDKEIHISGSKAVLARYATEPPGDTAPPVLSYVQEWRTRQECHSSFIAAACAC